MILDFQENSARTCSYSDLFLKTPLCLEAILGNADSLQSFFCCTMQTVSMR